MPDPFTLRPWGQGRREGEDERKKRRGHQCCPCAEQWDRDGLWGRWHPDYGVGGIHRL